MTSTARARTITIALTGIVLLGVVAAPRARVSAQTITLKKGNAVTILAPIRALQHDTSGTEVRLGGSRVKVAAAENNGISLDGRTDWKTLGFPLMKAGRITNVADKKNERFISIAWDGFYTTFDLDATTPFSNLLGTVFLLGGPESPEAAAYLKETDALLDRSFFGDAPTLTPAERANLTQFARGIGAHRIAVDKFKDRDHIVVDLGRDESVYNTLKLDVTARTAAVIRKSPIQAVKAAAKLQAPAGLSDIKVAIRVRYANALDDYGNPGVDTIIVIVPLAEAKRFAEAEITNQQLIDASVVLVNDDRVKVNLGG